MKKQTMVYYWIPSNRSGYDYIEVDHTNKEVARGNSANHDGHHVNNISVELKSRKELNKLIESFYFLSYEQKETLR